MVLHRNVSWVLSCLLAGCVGYDPESTGPLDESGGPTDGDDVAPPPDDPGSDDRGDSSTDEGGIPPDDTGTDTDDDCTDPESDECNPCMGKPGAPGTTARSIQHGSLDRTFLVHIPADLEPSQPTPIVFVHHGFTMSGQVMVDITGFIDIADREKFIAVFPDGAPITPWNVGTNICGAGALVGSMEDDFGFVDKMTADIDALHCVDRSNVFITGFSMGGYFANHLGCQQGDKYRAIAPHSGGTYSADCPSAPIPAMIVHGSADLLIDPACGQQSRDYWVERNGCSATFVSIEVVGGHCEWHQDCPDDGQVVLCMFDGMAHGWAGADTATSLYAGGVQYENASELIWEFFRDQLRD